MSLDTSGPPLDPRGPQGLPLAALLQALQGQQQPQGDPYISNLLANMNNEPPAMETAPQFPSPHAGYLDRLALAFQNLPSQNVGRDQGAGILQGLAQGFGQARGGAFQARQAETEQQNKQLASQAAAHLANRRWAAQSQAEAYKAIREVSQTQAEANRQAIKDKEGTRQFNEEQKLKGATLTETMRHNRADEATAARNAATAAAKAAGAGGEGADYSDRIKTTSLGNVYLDGSGIPGKEIQAARVFAKNNGATFVDKDTAARLEALDTARNQADAMAGQVMPSLAKNPVSNALGVGEMNALAAATGFNGDLKAYNDSKIHMIGALQALNSGQGSGMRITNNEIQGIQRSFPSVHEPRSSAQKKLEGTKQAFNLKELGFFRGTPGFRSAGASATPAPPGGVAVWGRDASGKPVRIK